MRFDALGAWVAAHPRLVVLAWVAAVALGAWGAAKLPQAVLGSTGGIEGSPSARAARVLRTEFANPFLDPLVVAVSSPRQRVGMDPYLDWVRVTAAALTGLPAVRRVSSFADTRDAHLRSADGHLTMLLVGLRAADAAGQQRAVLAVRAALAPPRAALLRLDPTAQIAVTGGPAAGVDINAWSAAGGDHAEKRALPLTLGILIVVFGTLIAAALPFLMGLATTTIALGAAFVLATLMPVSNLLGNVVTMIGLAIGIDYSLLMVTHYREREPLTDIAGAVAATVAQAGLTISWSGLTVMIGLLGLLFSPILETRCVGIGGALVVCVSVLAALTLLPATLVLLGPYIERWAIIPGRAHHARATALWNRLGSAIVRHPAPILILSGAAAVALALPVLQARSGFTNEPWFLARGMESRSGAQMLSAMRSDNVSLQIHVIVRATDGLPVLAVPHLRALIDYAARLQRDPRIAALASPVTLHTALGISEYTALYQDLERAMSEHPSIRDFLISRDQRAALFDLTPADGLAVVQIERLARDLGTMAPAGPFTVMIGGAPAEHIDFNDYMWRSFPKVFGFVIGATLLLLFIAFRSYLLPLEAVCMNLLAVAAGYGAVVAIFQFGWFNALVGLEHPFAAIPLEVPLMVFCLSFGLSMDYELFLLFRIQQEHAREVDTNRAIVAGLAAVAPVITGAGLIMAVVFGAFAGAELPVLKMIGVGLCVAVLVDATLIRAFVVPSAMALAGRWNWYPGARGRARGDGG
ncbi:MAG TPA: MMPL family transporter [Steroidobacteraceae bacterium]